MRCFEHNCCQCFVKNCVTVLLEKSELDLQIEYFLKTWFERSHLTLYLIIFIFINSFLLYFKFTHELKDKPPPAVSRQSWLGPLQPVSGLHHTLNHEGNRAVDFDELAPAISSRRISSDDDDRGAGDSQTTHTGKSEGGGSGCFISTTDEYKIF